MRWSCLACLVACHFDGGTPPGNGGGGSDAKPIDAKLIDAAPDAPPDAFLPQCFGTGAFYFCFGSVPTSTRNLTGNFDTDSCSVTGAAMMMVSGVQTCTVSGQTINVSGTLNVFGGLPLVLAATGDIHISSRIDASSVVGGPGPGANPSVCVMSGAIDGSDSTGGAGGGAGGSFSTPGAAGGKGSNGGTNAGAAAAAQAAPFNTLRGGCPGGLGADGGGGSVSGGPGGGAVFLAAHGTIAIDAPIDASGAGGAGGATAKGGGGGGGAGGMIVLWAPMINVSTTGKLDANGGGGGEGADTNNGGNNGSNPDATMPLMPAPGGPADGGNSVDGGAGSTANAAAMPGNQGTNGGGGGGGGLGVIRVLSGQTLPAPNVSPTPTS